MKWVPLESDQRFAYPLGGSGGGGILGLPQDWPTHPPTQADPPTQTPSYSPSRGGGLFHPASYVHCILKILTKGQGPKVQNCKNQDLNHRLHSRRAEY